MIVFLAARLRPALRASAALVFATAAWLMAPGLVLRGQNVNYTLYSAEGRRTLAVRTAGGIETFALEQLSGTFGLTFTEDRLSGGLVIGTRGQRIIAVPGQSFIQVAGRGVVGLEGQVRRERNSWVVPLDFLAKALGPAIGEPVIIRKTSHLVLIGNVQVPQISGTVEKTAAGARIVLNVEPMAAHRVTRDGNRLSVKFDAAALDIQPLTGFLAEWASSAKIEGTTVSIELGPSAASFKTDEDKDSINIELLPPAPVAPPPAPIRPGQTPPPTPPAAPQIEVSPGSLRTIVIDPGHGGEDTGSKSAGGTLEKDITLQLARRLRGSIEARLGLRVLLTRDGDENVPIDRRTSLANNNKADLFISLHANASARPAVRGAQVYTLDLGGYQQQTAEAEARRKTVPTLGGGTRVIDPMPWDLAQLPFAEQSALFGGLLIQRFSEQKVPLHTKPAVTGPMRALVGANMPAVLVELGFLTNAADEKALTTAEGQGTLLDCILTAIGDVRRGIPVPAPRGGTQ